MKFTCSQQQLSKALNTVSKAVTTRTTIPILKGILLEAEENQLKLAASDLDLSIERTLSATVLEEGSLVVSSKLFSDIIRKLPAGDIEIEQVENNTVLIRCKSSEFTIVGQPADEFPSMGEMENAYQHKILLEKELLKDMIKKTAFAASIDESKGVLNGVLFDMTKDALTMVALDGFRMAIAREQMEQEEDKKIIVSARILNEISKIISDCEEDTDISFVLDEKRASIELAQTKVSLRLLDGEFIKYKDILPKESKTKVTVSRSDLLDSIERASLLAKEGKNNLIKISLQPDRMIITSRSEEGNVKEEVQIQKEGEELEIGFNSKYLLDVLKVVNEEELTLEFNNSISPCLVKPILGDAFEYLILPVRIAGN